MKSTSVSRSPLLGCVGTAGSSNLVHKKFSVLSFVISLKNSFLQLHIYQKVMKTGWLNSVPFTITLTYI